MRLLPLFLLSATLCLASCGESTETTDVVDTTATETDLSSAEPTPDCLFRVDTISDYFLKNQSEFKSYTWNEKSKEAKVLLTSGDSLYVHITGCNSISADAKLTRLKDKTPFTDSEHWFEEAMWIATHVDGFEPAILQEIHDKKQYEAYAEEDGVFFEMTSDQDFVISVQKGPAGQVATTLIHSYN